MTDRKKTTPSTALPATNQISTRPEQKTNPLSAAAARETIQTTAKDLPTKRPTTTLSPNWRVLKVPMKIVVEKALLDLEPTEEEHAEVSNFPYRELVGTIAFPTNHTKIECKCAVAVLSRFLHNWTRICIEAALDLVTYMVYSHDLGIVFTRLEAMESKRTSRRAGDFRYLVFNR